MVDMVVDLDRFASTLKLFELPLDNFFGFAISIYF
jgi:hypothetical protein